jgi:hypothetical protein
MKFMERLGDPVSIALSDPGKGCSLQMPCHRNMESVIMGKPAM